MHRTKDLKVWVAVRVERGFVSEVKAFQERKPALKQEKSWRRQMNPDYDETGVAKVSVRARRVTAGARAKAISQ